VSARAGFTAPPTRRTLEQVIVALLNHQQHQLEAIESAIE